MALARVPAPGRRDRARLEPVCPQAFRIGERAWGLQFHPEVSRADALHWIDDYRSDPDAIRIGLDPAPMRREAEPKLTPGTSWRPRALPALRSGPRRYSGVT